ncbi:MAG: lyase family protein [Saprospiraceae bacterium]
MSNAPLLAISPVDGRYASKTQELVAFFSEFALIKYRVKVEIEYFKALVDIPLEQLSNFPVNGKAVLDKIMADFSESDAQKIKDIEKITNHDVKAVEYFLKEKFDEAGLQEFKEFIHFGLTSQDINNTATPMMLKDGFEQVYLPHLETMLSKLKDLAEEWKDILCWPERMASLHHPPNLVKKSKCLLSVLKNNWSRSKLFHSRQNLVERPET